ncbi:MAG: hypothetical protein ACD_4C00377G0001 [uncultured bacterium (gcode 4)]|uniref:Uncharacterized protein n=1 Tax=uncultured bacterium (gcode 4) TaxID=1234023 RepID=K2FWG6_9BACT|nr:MAG: hypothetical protein ACD_4C00377G0001 [uncultured bacterium (gcode 4)]
MEIFAKNDNIYVTSDKKEVEFTDTKVIIDWFTIDFPGEYEKSGFMAHVIETQWKLLFQLRIEDKNIAYVPYDELEVTEEVWDIFWSINILIIKWSKNSIKIYENLEVQYVVPYWEAKDVFFSTLWQHPEAVKSYKIKELANENEIVFINVE